jgi:tetraacyldisaccharide 4'-kinase
VNPAIIEYLESVVYGDRKDAPAVFVGWMLRALSAVYRACLWVYLLPFRIGLRRQRRLDRPVISVGNLTVGGTGKTPSTQYLCRRLAGYGWSPAIMSYGYGGALHGRFGVVSDKTKVLMTPDKTGDEPVMLASSLPGVPVLVCKDRARSGRVAIQEMGADVLVLDDGFQVWKLYRDLDIVLVNIREPFDNGRTLPAGRLREPAGALRRADCVIAAGKCDQDTRDNTLAQISRIAPEMPIYTGRFRPSALRPLGDRSERQLDTIRGERVLALSSIANPAAFEETLASSGAAVVDKERLPDHHSYSDEDIDRVGRRAVALGAEFIVTTDKDAAKLAGREFAVPALALGIELELDDEAGFWELLRSKVGEPPQ